MPDFEIRERLNMLGGFLKQHWSRWRHDEFSFSKGKYRQVLGRLRIQNRLLFRRLKITEHE
jgi:hypothetical protein